MEKEFNAGFTLTGIIKATLATIQTKAQWDLHKEIERRVKVGLPFMDLVKRLNQMCRIEVVANQVNLDPKVGRTMIMNNLTNTSPTNTLRINYGALGTGTTAPADGDTAMETETYRKLVSSQTNSTNVGYVSMFYAATDCNGTYKEVGLFSDGEAGSGTGILVVHSAVNITKSAIQTLTIDHVLTLS